MARPSDLDVDNVDVVCRHLALVAIDGATDEVALTMDPEFQLHLDGFETDRWGYLALIDANRATHVTRPPLDVLSAQNDGDIVTARLEPRCLAQFRVTDKFIVELWLDMGWVENSE